MMDEDDKQVFLAAAILLVAATGQTHELIEESQVHVAVVNAGKLLEEVKKRHEKINAGLPYGLMELDKRQRGPKT